MDSKLLMDIMSIIIIILFSFGIVYVICGDYLKKGIISLVIGVCLSIICVKISNKMDSIQYIYDKPYAVEKIVALNDSYEINGEIKLLRSGYINEKLYYHYMVDNGNGRLTPNKISADNSFIGISDNPRIEWLYRYKRWFIFEDKELCHNIYIPEDAIKNNFNMDLE